MFLKASPIIASSVYPADEHAEGAHAVDKHRAIIAAGVVSYDTMKAIAPFADELDSGPCVPPVRALPRPKIFGPERLVEDPRIRALHQRLTQEMILFATCGVLVSYVPACSCMDSFSFAFINPYLLIVNEGVFSDYIFCSERPSPRVTDASAFYHPVTLYEEFGTIFIIDGTATAH